MDYDADEFATLLASLDAIGGTIGAELAVTEEKLGELRRQARAALKRRGDPQRYALGGTLAMLGLMETDSTVLLGLLANPDQMLRWMLQVRIDQGPKKLHELISAVLTEPARTEWCRRWGVHLQWMNRKALYDASVTSFITSGRAGPKERWRREPVSDDQTAIIDWICDATRLPAPALGTRGEAFDWIRQAGGDTRYWDAPLLPPASEKAK